MTGPASTPHHDVLVTGSSGHLGTALMLALPSLGFNPLGIDILPSETTTLVGSISDRVFISSVITANPSIQHIVHAATLHKPHVGSHSQQQFIDTNITGTLVLLEAAATLARTATFKSFVFISTTSTFGAALSPTPGSPAAWITESVRPEPKNIYGATKCAAEDLCHLAHKQNGLPVVVLRTSRFFPEDDDDDERRASMAGDNLKVLELAYRRVDVADVVEACRCAMEKAETKGWGRYIISAPPPFANDEGTLRELDECPRTVLARLVPGVEEVFAAKGWAFLGRLDRVYDSSRMVGEMGWRPRYDFASTVERLRRGEEWRSELSLRVGRKGYHAVTTGVYTKR
ncbi:unnamed protein product [Clonostachys chloroleuca]|uniref:NAD-dependent epimerase/dehydratase domain-containing protein n=1 Tax=Clonostachys chloroleuca TaxID=1926264 RepID=A0AA35LPH5_9HYPO|nr:unnamed protein product [Clonostachys chloroleuca]